MVAGPINIFLNMAHTPVAGAPPIFRILFGLDNSSGYADSSSGLPMPRRAPPLVVRGVMASSHCSLYRRVGDQRLDDVGHYPCYGISESDGGSKPSTPRLGTLAMGVPGRVGSGSDRFVANRRGATFASLGACERLPQTVDRLSETSNLLSEPLRVSLLPGEKTLHGLQLILNDLQLVDRFLLGSFQTFGFLHQLLGRLRSPNLQLAGSNEPEVAGWVKDIRFGFKSKQASLLG